MGDPLDSIPGDIVDLWTSETGIDNQFGYNDFLITGKVSKDGEMEIVPVDHFSEDTAKKVSDSGKFPSFDEFKANPMYRDGDKFYRYGEKGPLIVRRSIFSDECPKVEANFLYPFKSEDEIRAFAAFSGGKSQDDLWCGAREPGIEGPGSTRTPWDLETIAGLEAMKRALTAIQNAKTDPSKDKNGSAAKLESPRLTEIGTDLDNRIRGIKETNFHDQSAGDKFVDGLYVGAGFAVSGGIVAGIWMVAKKGVSKLGWPGKAAAVVLIVGGSLLGFEDEAEAATAPGNPQEAPSKMENTFAKVAIELVSGVVGGLNEDIVSNDEEMKMLEESRRIQASDSNVEKLWFATDDGKLPNDYDTEWQPQLCSALAADMIAKYGSAEEALRHVDLDHEDTYTVTYNDNEHGKKYPHTMGDIRNGVREALQKMDGSQSGMTASR